MSVTETPATAPARHRVTRIRQEARRRTLTVAEVERVPPSMARITFAGADLADYSSPGHDDHMKLFFPGRTTGAEPCKRDYTPRAFDAAAQRLVIDFVLHEGGPATTWAKSAAPGEVLEIGGLRGSTVVSDDFDWYLLIGDETALPAIGRRVEELRPGTRVVTVVAVNDASETQAFNTRADWNAHWVERSRVGDDDAASLLRAVENVVLPKGDSFVWIAAEAEVARTLRRHTLEIRRHPSDWLKASGYWVRGRQGAHAKLQDGG